MVRVDCPRAIAECPCSLTEEDVVPLFDDHYDVPSPPDAFHQVYVEVEQDEKKALVRFTSDGYQLHASLDALQPLNDCVSSKLADNEVISALTLEMSVQTLDIRVSPPLEHDVLSVFDQTGTGGINDDDPQYDVKGYTVTVHDEPFYLGSLHLDDASIQNAREAIDKVETALSIASGS